MSVCGLGVGLDQREVLLVGCWTSQRCVLPEVGSVDMGEEGRAYGVRAGRTFVFNFVFKDFTNTLHYSLALSMTVLFILLDFDKSFLRFFCS